MLTCFVPEIIDGAARLQVQDSEHLLRVLRMRQGEALHVAHAGQRYAAALDIRGQEAWAQLQQPLPTTEPALRITLYQGLPKGDKMDYIVQKCTEAGVHAIIPCLLSRCVARPDAKAQARQQARLQKIAREAAMQAGRTLVPQIGSLLAAQGLAERLAAHEKVLIPWEQAGTQPLREACGCARDIALVIGPEGGMSAQEVAGLGGTPITLGPRILRTETAGLAAAIALFAFSGDLDGAPGWTP